MKQSEVVERFSVKGSGEKEFEVVFRFSNKSDLRGLLAFVNSSRDEAEFLGQRHHETIKSEKEFLAKMLKAQRERKGVFLVVEVDSKIVGDASICPNKFDTSPHLGCFGIALREEFTGLGIGTRLAERMMELAETHTDFKIIDSGYFEKNRRSKALHKRLGFKEFGVLPNESLLRDGSYCDHVYVYKQIRELK